MSPKLTVPSILKSSPSALDPKGKGQTLTLIFSMYFYRGEDYRAPSPPHSAEPRVYKDGRNQKRAGGPAQLLRAGRPEGQGSGQGRTGRARGYPERQSPGAMKPRPRSYQLQGPRPGASVEAREGGDGLHPNDRRWGCGGCGGSQSKVTAAER